MRRIVFIILILLGVTVRGQQMSFIEVDTSTYNQYMRGDWKALINTGGKALQNNIDYYYLQMRMGYASFMLQRYGKAIKHYKSALNHSSNDPTANEYLYYSYVNSGRIHEAKFLAHTLSDNLKENLHIKDTGIISFGLNHSYLLSDVSSETIQSIADGIPSFQDGLQKATYNINSTSFHASHMLGPHIIISHSGTFMSKSEFSYIVDNNTPYLSDEQSIQQREYSLNASIRLAEGFNITPGFHFISTVLPIFNLNDYGFGTGRNRIPYSNYTIRKYVPSVKLAIEKPYFDFNLSYLHHSFNEINTNQVGLHGTLYPAANLNYYLSLNSYFQFFETNLATEQSIVLNAKGGIKLMKNLWLELYATLPDQYNYYDIVNNVAFNQTETFKEAYGANIIIPFYKIPWKLFFNYQFKKTESSFFPENNLFQPLNQHIYHSQIITGGIIWTR